MAKDYEVGYGKPPKEHQFKRGNSANKKGRPPGAMSLKADLAAELGGRVPITENGKRRKATRQQVLLKAQVQKAMKGDNKAGVHVIALIIKAFGLEGETKPAEVLPEADQQLLDAYVQGLLREGGQS